MSAPKEFPNKIVTTIYVLAALTTIAGGSLTFYNHYKGIGVQVDTVQK